MKQAQAIFAFSRHRGCDGGDGDCSASRHVGLRFAGALLRERRSGRGGRDKFAPDADSAPYQVSCESDGCGLAIRVGRTGTDG